MKRIRFPVVLMVASHSLNGKCTLHVRMITPNDTGGHMLQQTEPRAKYRQYLHVRIQQLQLLLYDPFDTNVGGLPAALDGVLYL